MTPGPLTALASARRPAVTVIALLDVMLVMVFGLAVEAKLAEKRRTPTQSPAAEDDALRRRDRQIGELRAALTEQSARRGRAEDVMRQAEAIDDGLSRLGLSERERRSARRGLPDEPDTRRRMLDALGKMAAGPTPPGQPDPAAAAVVVHLGRDSTVTVVRRSDRKRLGSFAVPRGASDEDIRLRLHDILGPAAAVAEPNAPGVSLVLVSWDNVLLASQQSLVRAVDDELRLLASLPATSGRERFRIAAGFNPKGAADVLSD
jgi:hypothetical protein